jgi:hypothetical protein
VTAIADLLDPRTRACLLERLDELAELGRVMREAGSLAEAPEPVPLHRAARSTTTERTTAS